VPTSKGRGKGGIGREGRGKDGGWEERVTSKGGDKKGYGK